MSGLKVKGLTLARKPHRCDLCFQTIDKGELHAAHVVGPWNSTCDEAYTVRYCRFCDGIWDKATAGWSRGDFEDCTCPSDVLHEYIRDLQIRIGVREEIDTIAEWERMTKAARERWSEQGSSAPLWVHQWIDAPRPRFGSKP